MSKVYYFRCQRPSGRVLDSTNASLISEINLGCIFLTSVLFCHMTDNSKWRLVGVAMVVAWKLLFIGFGFVWFVRGKLSACTDVWKVEEQCNMFLKSLWSTYGENTWRTDSILLSICLVWVPIKRTPTQLVEATVAEIEPRTCLYIKTFLTPSRHHCSSQTVGTHRRRR